MGAFFNPNKITWYLQCLYLYQNAVFHSSLLRIYNRLYATIISSLIKNQNPTIRSKKICISGKKCLFLRIIVFKP